MPFTLLLGGARSGKSSMAQRLALASARPVVVVATADAGDAEMAERIRRHREGRPPGWLTLEVPLDLGDAIAGVADDSFVVLDCLTLWVSNLLGAGRQPAAIIASASELAHDLARRRGVVVTNEVGLGIVPVNEMAREFRDVLGAVNGTFAAAAERSLLMVAGRALPLEDPAALLHLPPD
jgi:adenosyl cobinamide kinase/adenosyl cobinamide phosphate guanylyltransferase